MSIRLKDWGEVSFLAFGGYQLTAWPASGVEVAEQQLQLLIRQGSHFGG
ncbi:hypothetical protein [Hymenobacter sediminis]|nr:hypothetical protein [Hymenobacter sediminis]